MAEDLGGVRLLKRKGKHDRGWSCSDRLAVSRPKPSTRAMFSVDVCCIARGCVGQEFSSLFFWVLGCRQHG